MIEVISKLAHLLEEMSALAKATSSMCIFDDSFENASIINLKIGIVLIYLVLR